MMYKKVCKIMRKINNGGSTLDRYDPPYTITDGMLERVASISEKLGRISTARGLENKPHLRRNQFPIPGAGARRYRRKDGNRRAKGNTGG